MIDVSTAPQAAIDAMPLDGTANAGASRFARLVARCVARLLWALHESRRRQGERELARYRHLIWKADDGAF
jgi:hypothetical protein